MVEHQIRARGVSAPAVLQAMERVPRQAFVPESMQELAYADGPLPIGEGQTISQPYVVAAMSEALEVKAGDRVLEIGTGSGYQAAILAEMGLEVYTIEYIHELAVAAKERLRSMGYAGIRFRCGDGNQGWPEKAPFDGIIVTAAPAALPQALGRQLGRGGHLVIPVGRFSQDLRVYRKTDDGELKGKRLFGVRFVPMVGG
jgi:protein-L-isoaspartate(D-aspartate) O-methyltransferase